MGGKMDVRWKCKLWERGRDHMGNGLSLLWNCCLWNTRNYNPLFGCVWSCFWHFWDFEPEILFKKPLLVYIKTVSEKLGLFLLCCLLLLLIFPHCVSPHWWFTCEVKTRLLKFGKEFVLVMLGFEFSIFVPIFPLKRHVAHVEKSCRNLCDRNCSSAQLWFNIFNAMIGLW